MPVQMPLPTEAASNIDSGFHLESAGRFQLQIETTATASERALHRETTEIPVSLTMTISGPGDFRLDRQVTRMEPSQWARATDTYTAVGADDVFVLPRSGDYEIEIHVRRPLPLFAARGGVIRLERLGPSTYGLVYVVARFVAYACFVFAASVVLFIGTRSRKSVVP